MGKPIYQPSDLWSGESLKDAAKIFKNILENKATSAQRDVVIANAGMAISCMKSEASLLDCMEEARESLVSGWALECLEKLVN